MSDSTIAIDRKTLSEIYKDLAILAKTITSLSEKLETMLPTKFGSRSWWTKETMAALKSLEKGDYREFLSKKTYLAELQKREHE